VIAQQVNTHSSFGRKKKVPKPVFLQLELQPNVEGVIATRLCALRSHLGSQTILLCFPPFTRPLLSFVAACSHKSHLDL